MGNVQCDTLVEAVVLRNCCCWSCRASPFLLTSGTGKQRCCFDCLIRSSCQFEVPTKVLFVQGVRVLTMHFSYCTAQQCRHFFPALKLLFFFLSKHHFWASFECAVINISFIQIILHFSTLFFQHHLSLNAVQDDNTQLWSPLSQQTWDVSSTLLSSALHMSMIMAFITTRLKVEASTGDDVTNLVGFST